MNWTYVSGVCLFLLAVGGAFLWGWFCGFARGKKEGDDQGWDRGYREGRTHEREAQLKDPFHKRMLNANRRAMPRPDSAGPVRVHRARVTGDFRLPSNRSLEEQRRYLAQQDQTKFNPNPLEES